MKVKSLVEISNPKQWKNLPISNLKDSGFPVYGANGIIGFYNEYNHEHPTIAITCRGATCGNIHITLDKSYITSNAMALDDLDESECALNYLAKYLQYRGLTDVTTGAAQPQITRANLEKVKIPLPPLDDQIRIAHLLGKVEALIAQRKQHLQQLDDLLKSVFLEMFGDPVRNEKGWEYTELGGYITHLTSGGRGWAKYYSESGKRFIRSLDVQMNHIGEDDIAYVNPPSNAEADRTRVQSGDVLLTITGSKIGRVCFVPENFEEAYISQHVSIIRTNGLNPVFLSFYLSAEHSGQLQIKKQQYGQAKPGLNLTQIRNFQIPLVDISTQNLFATIFEKVESLKSRYQQSLLDLESLYGALSQQAFKGDLDLSQAPLPETEQPADEVAMAIPEPEVADNTMAIHLPESDSLPDALTDKATRNELFAFWLESYCQQIGNTPFSASDFLAAAQTRIAELHPDNEFELGLNDYEQIKHWVFEALNSGRLQQVQNIIGQDENGEPILGNKIELKAGIKS